MSIFRKIRSWWSQEAECQKETKTRRSGYPGRLDGMYETQEAYVSAFNDFCDETNMIFSAYLDVVTAYRIGKATIVEYDKARKGMKDFLDNKMEIHNLFVAAQDFAYIAGKNMNRLNEMFGKLHEEERKIEEGQDQPSIRRNKERYRKHRA